MQIKIKNTLLSGVKTLEYDAYEEFRGNIWTTYKKSELQEIEKQYALNFHHDKFSVSNYNVFRGFHGDYKSTKLVTCVYGEITQFVLDWRHESETFRKVLTFQISRKSRLGILIPPGCGNAYHVKSEQAVYHYKLSYTGDYFDAEEQFTVPWHSTEIKNFPIKKFSPITSERDR